MASKVKKGFLYYLAWFLFICLGIFCIFCSILIFNPGKDIFGINICYTSQITNQEYKTINVDGKDILFKDLGMTEIKVNSSYSDLVIETDTDKEQIGINLETKILGFAKYDEFNTVNVSLSYSNGVVNIDVEEPVMSLALNKSSIIKIVLPKTVNLQNVSLNYNTENGSFSIGQHDTVIHSLNALDVKTKNGSITLGENSSYTSGIINITADSSTIDVNCNISNSLNVETNSGKLYVDKISGDLNIESESLEARCGIIEGDIYYSCDNGYININSLGSASNSTGSFTASETTRIANIKINHAYGNIAIPKGEKSDITINELVGEALIETTTGDVIIDNCSGTASIKTTSGSVKITQVSSTAKTAINTTSGKITANFTEIGTADLISEKGTIVINVATDKAFKFNYSTEKNIYISFITDDLEKIGSILIATDEENITNYITAISSNTIKLYNGYTIE